MFPITMSGCVFGPDDQADLGPFVTLILAFRMASLEGFQTEGVFFYEE